MKKLICSLMAVCALAFSGYSQEAETPVLDGPFIDFLGGLSTWTNWGVATFGLYAPKSADGNKGAVGAGAVALYNITPWVASGIGVDWINGGDVTMPSAQVQFQAPLRIGGTNGVTVRPFAFTGIATPVGNSDEVSAPVVGLVGAGVGVKIYKGLGGFYAIEKRTEVSGMWHLFGVAWSASF